ncbi:TPA: hypothetical protein DCZ36_03165 [Candidatus Gracilibacteria bacterium]|nr:hypothetical protein [Candidatus Gracilibacteria bacterium]
MDKIKAKSTGDSFFRLQDSLFGSPLERAKLHLGIAKNLFILSAFLYFFALLMTIGGSFIDYAAKGTFFLYPVFVFSCLALLYNICSYGIVIYLEKYLFLRYIVFILCSIIFLFIVSIHIGAYTFLLSLLGIK